MQKKLLRLALPIMGANFLQTLYNLADSYFLGKVGKEALAAPSIAFTIVFFLIIFAGGFGNAGTTLISQSLGAGNKEKTDFYLGQMILMMSFISLLLGGLFLMAAKPMLILLQTPQGLTFDYTLTYMQIIFAGIPFMFMMFIFQSALQGIGDTMTPLMVQIVTVALNILLDWLLIFGIGPFPQWGPAGAAVATVISRLIASIIAIIILVRGKKGIAIKRQHLIPNKKALFLLLKIGMPASLGQGISALGFSVMQGVVNGLGAGVIAAFGIGNRIISLFNMPAMGISRATGVLVGQFLGAGDEQKAREVVKQGVRIILIFITMGMVLTFFKGASVMRFFIDDPEVTEIGRIMFRIFSPSVIFFSLYTVLMGAFQGGGDTKPMMMLNIFRLWGVRVPLAYGLILGLGMGHLGIWWAMFASNLITALIAIVLYRTGRWAKALDPAAL